MPIVDTKTTVYLTEEEAKRFVAFQKHYAFIQLLDSLGVFDIRSGSVEVHFDAFGRIGLVDIHNHYRP